MKWEYVDIDACGKMPDWRYIRFLKIPGIQECLIKEVNFRCLDGIG